MKTYKLIQPRAAESGISDQFYCNADDEQHITSGPKSGPNCGTHNKGSKTICDAQQLAAARSDENYAAEAREN
jgi:hypothetical protein